MYKRPQKDFFHALLLITVEDQHGKGSNSPENERRKKCFIPEGHLGLENQSDDGHGKGDESHGDEKTHHDPFYEKCFKIH